MEYLWVKHLHVTCVVLSISLFALRGTLELTSQPWRQGRLLRVAPHIVDTVLLGSALWLAWRIGQYPFVDAWLTAKVLALLLYIVLGMRALARNTPQAQRLPYFAGALLSVGYILGVALTRSASWALL
ncbi:MAG: SirB2 family protein [Rhodoferax sp.]|nr:SirB2 family protein [Rhodoferax sp.]